MANILQVTTPSVNTDNRSLLDGQEARGIGVNQGIRGPIDPGRVTGVTGQETEKTGDAAGQGLYSVVDFESNYGAFIQKLREETELAKLFEKLLFTDMADFKLAGQTELVERFFQSINMDSPQELLEFLKGQEKLQAKFTGPFFDGLRNIMNYSPSEGLKETVMAFLRGYNDCSSGRHLLQQMKSLTDDIGRLMYRQYRAEFKELADIMNWNANNGDTSENTSVLNGRLIPFLSSYISRTHDYGSVRDAVMLFIFNAVRYENGDEDHLWQMFDKMVGHRDFERLFKGDAEVQLKNALSAMQTQGEKGNFANLISELLLKGAGGEGGLEHIQQFYTIINGLLLNESVYMPLIHLLLPFQFKGKPVMSELWVDPDSKKAVDDESRKVKMFLKFDIQSLGKFELLLAFQDWKMDMQLYVPSVLTEQSDKIQGNISEILNKNGIGLNRLLVKEWVKEGRVEEVFPEIREKERTINVRI